MKANAQVEFIICVDSLKTIGIFLLDEGMYQIRMNLYIQNQKNTKIPIPPKETFHLRNSTSQYLPQHCIDNFYMTDAFLLRQWTEEEKFEIKNGCRFSVSIPYIYREHPIYLEIELMYYDLALKVVTFASVSMSKFKIENVCSGIYEYVPVILGDDHFSLLNIIVLGSLTNFDFKMNIFKTPNQTQKTGEDCSITMKQLYAKVMDPLRNAYKSMQHFFYNMELEMERSSSSGGMQYFRQSRSFQVLPYTSTESILKNETNLLLLSKLMANEFKVMRTLIGQLWVKVLQGIKIQNSKVFRQLKKESLANLQARFSAFTTKEVIPVVDHQYTMIPQVSKQFQDQADIQIKRVEYQKLLEGPSKIVDLKIISEIKDKLVIFEKHYVTRPVFQASRSKQHLIVLVHGYQGHSYDMRMLENYMCLRFPQHMLLVALSNQMNTEGDILQMGKNLSEEIKNYVATWSFTDKLVISFIAHSLGGLIVRAALPYLDYDFHTLMTLGSPHLGYVTNDKPLIKFGMWFFQKIKKSQSLAQLNCQDDTLLRLSKFPGIGKFKNIILFGSTQDHYVTSESSMLMKIQKDGIHNEMAINILKQLHQNEVLRIVVDYKFYDGDFDTFLGRKAHIAILESHFLNQYIIYNLGDYFR